MELIENAKNIKLSERTKQILVALATFNESFWEVSELLIEKSEDEKIQKHLKWKQKKNRIRRGNIKPRLS